MRQLLQGVGREALARFRTWRPDLILMDIRMPEMDRFQTTRLIRALPEGRTLPIVALTASSVEEERREILAAGCDDLVSKPVDYEHPRTGAGGHCTVRDLVLPPGVLPAPLELRLAEGARLEHGPRGLAFP